ncbi:MAG: hypothetical protein HDT43_06135 [Ruminococcaceae bacterium]|nr:hypothetical protein [Oscillospiraceae bacterium]
MSSKGFIKIPRDITNKPWYGHEGTLRVYLELHINAAWKDFEYNGRTLKKGQFITSIGKLAARCQLSVQQTRTALSHLKSTNEITIETTSKFSIITILDGVSDDETDKPVDDLANLLANTRDNNRNRKGEKEDKTEIKEKEKEEAASPLSPSPSFNSFDSSNPLTRDELITRYGIDNVTRYESKLAEWKSKKGITGNFDDISTIAKWLEADNVQNNAQNRSSFNMDKQMERILNFYRGSKAQ